MQLSLMEPVCSAGKAFSARKHTIIRFAMRVSLLYMLLLAGTVSLLTAHPGKSQELHQITLTIGAGKESLEGILKGIEQKTGLSLVFPLDEVERYTAISFPKARRNVKETLDLVLRDTQLGYRQINSRTILLYVLKKESAIKEHDRYSDAPLLQEPVPVVPVQVVRGKVTDERGEGLPGVSVLLKGTQRGTVTDREGNFSLEVPDEHAVLVFSFVGYVGREVTVGDRTSVEISLEVDQKSLEEVVVIGYGTQSKELISTAITKVEGKKLEDRPVSNALQGLVGHTPGVWLQQVSGEPGTAPSVRIRGNGSITSSNSPLYVIDGFPTADGSLFNSIPASEIESVEILKDAAAAAIYGSKAGNGVIIITTKKGKAGKTRFTFDAMTGLERISKKIDMLSPEEYLEIARESVTNQGIAMPEYLVNSSLWHFTDWQDVIFRTAPVSQYKLGASGGNEKVQFNISGGYTDQQGVLRNSYMKRYNLLAGFETQLNRYLKSGINVNVSFVNERTQTPSGNNSVAGIDGVISYALSSPPIIPVWKENGDYFVVMQDAKALEAFNVGLTNPLNKLDANKRYFNRFNQLANVFFEVEPIKSLKIRTTLNAQYSNIKQNQYIEAFLAKGNLNRGNVSTPDFAQIYAQRGTNTALDLYWSNIASYDFSLNNNHNFSALAGYDVQKRDQSSVNVVPRTDANTPVAFDNTIIKNIQGALLTSGTTSQSLYVFDGLFGRLNYNFSNKYIVSTSLRRDRSSRFGPGNRSGVFSSVSGAWNIAREGFFNSEGFISELKLRMSYGVTGNDQVGGNYPWIASMSKSNYVFGGGANPARVITYLPGGFTNRSLGWERNRQTDLGIDLGFFRNRIHISADAYLRKSNTILSAAVPIINGKAASVIQNVGTVQNKGLEFDLNTQNLKGQIHWNTNLNLSLNRNLIVNLADGQTQLGNGTAGSVLPNVVRNYVGRPMGDLYLYIVEGIFNNQEELDKYPKSGTQLVGDLRFKDIDNDGRITASDMELVGNYQPNFVFGISNTISYKNFDCNILIDGTQGGEIINVLERPLATGRHRENLIGAARDRWKSEQEPGSGKFPKLGNPHGVNVNANTRFLYDASFLRIRNLSLGYNLPNSVLKKAGIQSARVFLVAQNVYTFTKFTGYNPEANAQGNNAINNGSDEGSYPLARNYSIGLHLSF